MGFKLALVPFHFWAADVYQGAPSPGNCFIATASKVGVFAVLMRFSLAINLQASPFLMNVFSGIAIASMVLGNILALRQRISNDSLLTHPLLILVISLLHFFRAIQKALKHLYFICLLIRSLF